MEEIDMRTREIQRNVLSVLGLRRSGSDWFLHAMLGFGAGVVVGAATALMVTPKTGREMRTDLSDGANRIVRRGREQLDQIKSRMGRGNGTTAEDRAGV
jgi:hypothetical protein